MRSVGEEKKTYLRLVQYNYPDDKSQTCKDLEAHGGSTKQICRHVKP